MTVGNNIILDKAKAFGVRCMKLRNFLCHNQQEFIISSQLVRSGTSIGANIVEAQFAQSRADFIAKMSISKKEAAESRYWLELLYEAKYLSPVQFQSLDKDCEEILAILTKILKTSAPRHFNK